MIKNKEREIEMKEADYLAYRDELLEKINAAAARHDREDLIRHFHSIALKMGISKLSHKTGIPRQTLYVALSPKGNPSAKTMQSILMALGIRFQFLPLDPADGQDKAK